MTMTIDPALVELAEREALTDLSLAAPEWLAKPHGIGVERVGSAVVMTLGAVNRPVFNRAVGLGVSEPAAPEMVEAILERFRSLGLSHYAVQVSPAAQPSELPRWLAARGLAARGNWAVMYRGTKPPPRTETPFQVRPVPRERAPDFSEIVCAVLGIPPMLRPWLEALVGRVGWHCYAAYDGRTPVAAAALYVRGDIGWLGLATTQRSQRGRGAQGALMARRIRDALDLGCRWLITEAPELDSTRPGTAFGNMVRGGFQLSHLRMSHGP